MGVSNSMIWITWFCTIVIEMLIPLIISTILLSSWGVFSNKTLPRTDITLIFVVLLLYTTATISFCCLASALFKKGKSENLGTFIPQVSEVEKRKLLRTFYKIWFFFFLKHPTHQLELLYFGFYQFFLCRSLCNHTILQALHIKF